MRACRCRLSGHQHVRRAADGGARLRQPLVPVQLAAEAINELDVPAYIYLPMIGFLNGGSSWEYAQMAATFRKGFGETGLLIVVLALVKPLSPPGDLSGQLICGPIEA